MLIRCAFQQAQRGCARRDDPTACRACSIERGGSFGIDLAPFGVHHVVGGVVCLDRQEGASPHVQRQRVARDPCLIERGEQVWREMQRCGGGRHRAILVGKDRLVIDPVGIIQRALLRDIGRQRHPPGAFQQHLDRLIAGETQREAAIIVALFGHGRDIGGKLDCLANPQPLGIADEGLPAAEINPLVQRGANARFSAHAFELRRDDAGIVEHQHIAAPQQLRQVANATVGKIALATHNQHPRRIARPHRAQSDVFRRKVKVEQVYAHAGGVRSLC